MTDARFVAGDAKKVAGDAKKVAGDARFVAVTALLIYLFKDMGAEEQRT
jgi:hypothetical protein